MRQVTYGKSARAPRAPAMHLLQVRQLPEGHLVAQWHVDHAVMREGAHGGDASGFLASAKAGGGDEQAGVLAPEAALHPLVAGAVEEGLPLGGEVAIAGGDTEEHAVVFLELLRGDVRDGVVFGRGVQHGQDLLGEGFGDPARRELSPLLLGGVVIWGGRFVLTHW